MQYAGICCVIAESIARLFLRNAVNMGIPILELKDASRLIAEGDILTVRFKEGVIINETKQETYNTRPIPDFLMGIYDAGGLEGHIVERLKNSSAG
jgi:3-isopropylmalate/(R)-2-methylmalate dehydratase small subunit